MGLPRSNLVKKSAPPAASPESSRAANSFEAAKTILHPFELAPSRSVDVIVDAEAVPLGDDATFDESLSRNAIPPAAVFPSAVFPSPDDSAPSAASLLERATRLDPMRMTWESIIVHDDPILDAKREPHVAERRAQFRKVVKATLGACVALCVAALAASAIASAGDRGDEKPTAAAAGKTAPTAAVVPIEKLDLEKRGRAVTSRALPSSARRQSTRR